MRKQTTILFRQVIIKDTEKTFKKQPQNKSIAVN